MELDRQREKIKKVENNREHSYIISLTPHANICLSVSLSLSHTYTHNSVSNYSYSEANTAVYEEGYSLVQNTSPK